MNNDITVSICCTTYNHEKFIADALEGFLSQKTSFLYEIIVHDDASIDRTPEIINNYANKYPGKIIPILQTKNQFSRGIKPFYNFIIPKAKGKFSAICEGDDYWTDPYKLQKQVDFLENNPEFSMCCTNYSEVDEKRRILKKYGWGEKYRNPVIGHLTILENYKPKLLTSVIRKSALPDVFPEAYAKSPNGDNFLFALVTESGPAAYLDFISGCYRINRGGVWGQQSVFKQKEMQLKTCSAMKEYFIKPAEIKAINARIARIKLILAFENFKNKDIFQGFILIIESIKISRKPLKYPFISIFRKVQLLINKR